MVNASELPKDTIAAVTAVDAQAAAAQDGTAPKRRSRKAAADTNPPADDSAGSPAASEMGAVAPAATVEVSQTPPVAAEAEVDLLTQMAEAEGPPVKAAPIRAVERGPRRSRPLAPVDAPPIAHQNYYGETTVTQRPDALGQTVNVRELLGLRFQGAVSQLTILMCAPSIQHIWQREGLWVTRCLTRLENASYTSGLGVEKVMEVHAMATRNLSTNLKKLKQAEAVLDALQQSDPPPPGLVTSFPQPFEVQALIVGPHMLMWVEVIQTADRLLGKLAAAYHTRLIALDVKVNQERLIRTTVRSFINMLRPVRMGLVNQQFDQARRRAEEARKMQEIDPNAAAAMTEEAKNDIVEAAAEAKQMLVEDSTRHAAAMQSGDGDLATAIPERHRNQLLAVAKAGEEVVGTDAAPASREPAHA